MGEHILIVDDEAAIRELLISQVSYMGYTCDGAPNGREALRMAGESPAPALVLSDLQMPDFSGLDLLRGLQQLDENIQVVMVTGNSDLNTVRQCLREGAYDYLVKPYDLEDLSQTVERALERRRLKLELLDYQSDLESKVLTKTAEVRQTRDIALMTLAKLAECRDDTTGYHLDRIQWYSKVLTEALASRDHELATPDFIEQVFKSSPLHDIGKVAIPDSVLLKQGSLDDDELDIMRTHTVRGGDTLRSVIEKYRSGGADSSEEGEGARFLRVAMEIAYNHHERWDGNGYPYGLSGQEIPLSARVVALADAYDAITSERPYKKAFSHEEAIRRITIDRGKHFDPEIVDAFLDCEKRFDLIQRQMQGLMQVDVERQRAQLDPPVAPTEDARASGDARPAPGLS